jgi:hypothetical protein
MSSHMDEDQLTASMYGSVIDQHPTIPPVELVLSRAAAATRRSRRRKGVAGMVCLAAFLATTAFALGGMSWRGSSTGATFAGEPTSDAQDSVLPPTLSLPGWESRLVTDKSEYREYEFTRGPDRLQVSSYPGDFIDGRVGLPEDRGPGVTQVAIRGVEAYLEPQTPGRYRLDWLEAGWTLEADGSTFASPEEFEALVDTLVRAP